MMNLVRQSLLLLILALIGGTILMFKWQPKYYRHFISASLDERIPNDETVVPDIVKGVHSPEKAHDAGHLSTTTTLHHSSLVAMPTEDQKRNMFQELRTSQDDVFEVEVEQRRRKTHLDLACNQLGKTRTVPAVSWESTVHFLASDELRFLFCFVPKVSCTTWKDVMSTLYKAFPLTSSRSSLALKNTPTSKSGRFLKMSDIRDPHEVRRRWRTYSKVLFTREPLERVLSAYLDKFAIGTGGAFERQFGAIILKRYRNVTSAKRATFPLRTVDKISFEEFIQFITDAGPRAKMTQMTDHWLPISRITKPCRFKYDFIGRYETLQYDAPYVLNFYNLSSYVSFPEVHGSRSREKLVEAYANVPQHLIDRLVNYYLDDYALFGYSANEILDVILNGRL